MVLAKKVKALRKDRGYTMQQVADGIGYTKTHVWELEKGRVTNPTLNVLQRLGLFFGVPTYMFADNSISAEKLRDYHTAVLYYRLSKANQHIVDSLLQTLLTKDSLNAR